MRITIWGCRGSLPTPGPGTVRYGGNTTCLEVSLDDGTLIVLDAGSGLRDLGRALRARGEITELYLYLTHTHWDHLMGFPFFEPGYSTDFVLHVRGGPMAKGLLQESLENQMRPPHFPVPFEALKARFEFHLGDPRPRTIGSCEVEPIALNHPGGGYGFKLTERGKSFVFLPDNELAFPHVEGMERERYVDFCRGAALLLHDAQYDDREYLTRRGWGHTRVSDAVRLALDAGVERLGLFHHDPDHTDDQVDLLVEEACARTAGEGPECFGAAEGMEIVL